MKEEMQGFHMNQISKMFFGEIAHFLALSQSKGAAPRIQCMCNSFSEFRGLVLILHVVLYFLILPCIYHSIVKT